MKKARNYQSKNMVGGGFIPGEGQFVDFSRSSQTYFFKGWSEMVKFHFSLVKLRKQPFFAKNVTEKCHASKSRGARPGA